MASVLATHTIAVMKLFFDDVGFDGQLQRSVGKCDVGMANVGECLYIASQGLAPVVFWTAVFDWLESTLA